MKFTQSLLRDMTGKTWLGLTACLFLLSSRGAFADWALEGAQFSCDKKSETFQLLSLEETSSDPPGTVYEKPGFKRLADGKSNLECTLGHYRLKASIEVWSPGGGMCEDSGGVRIESLSVNGVELLPERTNFNWSCRAGDAALQKVQVNTQERGISVTKCVATTPEPGGVANTECKSTPLDVEATAAQNAKVDHDLADLQTQAATATSKLPPGNDIAPLTGREFPGSNVPLCAHWVASFVTAMTDEEHQRHGRIAGRAGERVPMYAANPQVCGSAQDYDCQSRAYLLPGDRVDVGFICGSWTYVQFEPRLRSKPQTRGWVGTDRLYGVDAVPVAAAGNEPTTSPYPGNPLLDATWKGDVARIKVLLAAGAPVNGVRGLVAPISLAVDRGDAETVRALLAAGSASAQSAQTICGPTVIRAASSESREMLTLLTQGGFSLNCEDGPHGFTPLMLAAGDGSRQLASEMQLPAFGVKVIDPPEVARRLIAAGADPNIRGPDGGTALFNAIIANNVDVALSLLEHGANPNVSRSEAGSAEARSAGDYQGSTPLMAAMWWYSFFSKDPTLFRLLLEHHADPNYRNPSPRDEESGAGMGHGGDFTGQTALTKAAEMGFYSLATLLLAHGADPKETRSDGASPVDIARENKHPLVGELIQRYLENTGGKKKAK